MRILIVLVGVAMAMTCSRPGKAFESCQVYLGDESSDDIKISELIQRYSRGAIRICERLIGMGDEIGITVHAAQSIIRGDQGACYYSSKTLSPEDHGLGDADSTPTYYGEQHYFARPDGECPPHYDPAYRVTRGLSEGVFVLLDEFWTEPISSSDSLVKGLSQIENLDHRRSAMGLSNGAKDDPEFANKISVDSIVVSTFGYQSTPSYDFSISTPIGHLCLGVDIFGDEIKILGVSTVDY